MKSTFLEQILDHKRRRVSRLKSTSDVQAMHREAVSVRSSALPHALRDVLSNRERVNIIAEIKRASPSKGVINDKIDVVEIALSYQAGGACAISVLTEEDFFNGSLHDLKTARAATSLPILRKDFVVDEFQIFEAAAAGADAVLLIVAALSRKKLSELHALAELELGLDALVEVHDLEELNIAGDIGCKVIGVNNRSLHSFDVSLDISRTLIGYKPSDSVMISESGITVRDEISELRSIGFDGFLVGETLMRTGDPRQILEAWV